jgi:hypothetical protein
MKTVTFIVVIGERYFLWGERQEKTGDKQRLKPASSDKAHRKMPAID